jgi:hypothetical protein
MFQFCHHCGKGINQDQVPGQRIVCVWCKKEIGVVSEPKKEVYIDKTDELLRTGSVAKCPECQRLVEVRQKSGRRSLAPHMGAGPSRMCIFSGKPAPAVPTPDGEPQRPATSKDLSGYMNRQEVKVVACTKFGDPSIEVLNLEYLDKTDRIRVQIDAVRDILGGVFKMVDYPGIFKRPQLALWTTATRVVVARKHAQGGYEPMPDVELREICDEVRNHRQCFFP